MRKFVVAAMIVAGAAQGAQAADMPDMLRGSFGDGYARTRPIWDGFYVGGQAGYGVTGMDFSNANKTQIGNLLANTVIENEYHVSQWPVLGKSTSHPTVFGAFAGYNAQFEDVVMGADISYMNGKSGGSATGSMGRSFTTSDGYNNNVTVRSSAALAISDLGTIRLRGGYMIDNFLPYAFAGVALGRGDITRSASVTASGTYVGTAVPPLPNYGPNTVADTSLERGRLLYGYAFGAGVDVMLIGGLFLRAEYEYLRFTASIDTGINTVRVGLGYKF